MKEREGAITLVGSLLNIANPNRVIACHDEHDDSYNNGYHEGDEKTEVTSISKVGRRGLGQVVTFGGLGQIHYWVRSTFSS